MGVRSSRLSRVRRAIESSPVRRGVLAEAYERFRDCGELPGDDHLAYEVIQQALRGGEEEPVAEAEVAERVRKARLTYRDRARPRDTWPPSVRAMLFDEALFEIEPLQRYARAAIGVEVALGGDVENRAFAARHGIPCFGSVGAHVIGYSLLLSGPPYEHQALRLLVRMDNIRGKAPQDNPRWLTAQTEAEIAFRERGELPADDLHLEMLLVNLEFELLMANRHGASVESSMAVLDEVAQSTGAKLERAFVKLVEMAKAKVFWAWAEEFAGKVTANTDADSAPPAAAEIDHRR